MWPLLICDILTYAHVDAGNVVDVTRDIVMKSDMGGRRLAGNGAQRLPHLFCAPRKSEGKQISVEMEIRRKMRRRYRSELAPRQLVAMRNSKTSSTKMSVTRQRQRHMARICRRSSKRNHSRGISKLSLRRFLEMISNKATNEHRGGRGDRRQEVRKMSLLLAAGGA